MKSLALSFILFSMFFISCGSSSNSTTYQDPHSRAHSQMHNELLQEEIDKELNKQVGHFIGQYEGILPCADCDGIVIQLELFQNFTYQATVKQGNKLDSIEEINGSFALQSDGIVALDKTVSGTTFFQKNEADLTVLDQNAKEIISGMNDAYVLKRFEKKVKPFEDYEELLLFAKNL